MKNRLAITLFLFFHIYLTGQDEFPCTITHVNHENVRISCPVLDFQEACIGNVSYSQNRINIPFGETKFPVNESILNTISGKEYRFGQIGRTIVHESQERIFSVGTNFLIDPNQGSPPSLVIFDLKGNIVKAQANIIQAPWDMAVSKDGDLIIVGGGYIDDKSVALIRKYDLNGELTWERKLPTNNCNGFPKLYVDEANHIYVSNNNVFSTCWEEDGIAISSFTIAFNNEGEFLNGIYRAPYFFRFQPITPAEGLAIASIDRSLNWHKKGKGKGKVQYKKLFDYPERTYLFFQYDSINNYLFVYSDKYGLQVFDLPEKITNSVKVYQISDQKIGIESLISMNLQKKNQLKIVQSSKVTLINY